MIRGCLPSSFVFLAVFGIFFISNTSLLGAEPRVEHARFPFWVAAGAETTFFSSETFSYGGRVTMGYGRGASIGFKAAWFFDDAEKLDVLELGFLLRLFFFGDGAVSGPYVQIAAGPALFLRRDGDSTVPSNIGRLSAGLELGWRFLFGNRFFLEPGIRGGYPFIGGAGISGGVSF